MLFWQPSIVLTHLFVTILHYYLENKYDDDDDDSVGFEL